MGDLRNLIIGLFVLFCWAHSAAGSPVQEPAGQLRFSELVYELSAANDRGTGSQGAHAAGELIISRLKDLAQVQIQTFFTPVRRHTRARVRVIDQITDLVTAETEATLPVVDDEILMDVTRDIIKVAAVDRTHRPGKTFTGFLKGYGLKSGAFACSASWDSSDIIVAGTDENDMAAAVNRIHDLQGGAVVVEGGVVVTELAMPIFGIAADSSLEETTDSLKQIQNALADRGVPFPDAMLTLITLTGAAIPFFRICEEGLVRLKNGKKTNLVVE